MKRLIFIVLYSFLLLNNSKAQTKQYWQQQVNYIIDVQLNEELHALDGFEKIEYFNNSPDTLSFLWFHIWPNAYKNDKTAFCEQQLLNRNTDFYFSSPNDKGYINQLSFSANKKAISYEYHPLYVDIIKLKLADPLPPNSTITIQTPFHVQLPKNFSRGGHIKNEYQATQWFPKPAVYDAKGWHIMPYLDQGEFYSEFGNFDVTITTPKDYMVAATGKLQNQDQLNSLKLIGKKNPEQQKNFNPIVKKPATITKSTSYKKKIIAPKAVDLKKQVQKSGTVEYHFIQNNVHDFAWFASKQFLVEYDTLVLNNKIIDVFCFYPSSRMNLKGGTGLAKKTLQFFNTNLGDYPYETATVVCGVENKYDGMEYPTITYINTENSKINPKELIAHELGHNWFYGIIATNERDHPWMDEGMNTFYTNKFMQQEATKLSIPSKNVSKQSKQIIPDNINELIVESLLHLHKAVPIDTTSSAFESKLYGIMVYELASKWMEKLESFLGKESFAQSMQAYYNQWKFKHPTPENFQQTIEATTGKKTDSLFALLKQSKPKEVSKKVIKPSFLLNLNNTNQNQYINILPNLTYNKYDGARLGTVIHNYQLPLPKFQFLANPSYAFGSNKLNFFGKGSLNKYTKKYWLQANLGLQSFTYDNFTSDAGKTFQLNVTRVSPGIKLRLYNDDVKSTSYKEVGVKMIYLREQNLNFNTLSTPTGPQENITTPTTASYVNRFYFNAIDNRVLYPYHFNLTIDQGKNFIRTAITAKQYFNYSSGIGGIEARFFAGKFFYLGAKTFVKQFETDRYHLNLSGPKGYEDYTYSDYFIGRSEFDGWQSQQIMERDGFFKVRTDLLGSKVGKTDNWLIALNLSGDLPSSINPLSKLPLPIKLKFYIDIGTYAESWSDNASTGRFLYNAGLQLPIFKDAVNIYFPLLMSKVYRDYNLSVLGKDAFSKTISFTINFNRLIDNKLFSNFTF